MKFLLIHTEDANKYRLVEATTPEAAVAEYLDHNTGCQFYVFTITELGTYGYNQPQVILLQTPTSAL
jgi:hypothetical protein